MTNVVMEDVCSHGPSLCLRLVVAVVEIAHVDPLQLANDASSMDSFETSPCNAGNHWRSCLEGRMEELRERSDRVREEANLGVGRVLRSLEFSDRRQRKANMGQCLRTWQPKLAPAPFRTSRSLGETHLLLMLQALVLRPPFSCRCRHCQCSVQANSAPSFYLSFCPSLLVEIGKGKVAIYHSVYNASGVLVASRAVTMTPSKCRFVGGGSK